MLSVQDWAQIRRLHRGGGSADQVDRSGAGVSKNTVKAALASDGPLKYERAQRVRSSMRWSRRSGSCSRTYPQMPATVIAKRIGWPTPNSGIDLSTLRATASRGVTHAAKSLAPAQDTLVRRVRRRQSRTITVTPRMELRRRHSAPAAVHRSGHCRSTGRQRISKNGKSIGNQRI
jgi:hypothetical protein